MVFLASPHAISARYKQDLLNLYFYQKKVEKTAFFSLFLANSLNLRLFLCEKNVVNTYKNYVYLKTLTLLLIDMQWFSNDVSPKTQKNDAEILKKTQKRHFF